MTHVLKSIDITANVAFKNHEKRTFSEYFSERVVEALKNNPACDVTTIKVDLRLSSLKPYHSTKVTTDVCQYLSSGKGKAIIKAGWKAVKRCTEKQKEL